MWTRARLLNLQPRAADLRRGGKNRGIGGYAEGILQRLQGERTFSPSPGNSLFATAAHERAETENKNVNENYAISDAPMSEEEWNKQMPTSDRVRAPSSEP
jgi:hypothetical protein